MMPDAVGSRLALKQLRRAGGFGARGDASVATGRVRRRRIQRLARRLARRLPGRRTRAIALPAAAFDLEAPHELTTAQLWSVWTVAQLESGLALRAWRMAPREQRVRAHRVYGAALEREARAARILAGRAAAPGPPERVPAGRPPEASNSEVARSARAVAHGPGDG
jgi:hypothetical protein